MSQLEYPKMSLAHHVGVSAMGKKCDMLAKTLRISKTHISCHRQLQDFVGIQCHINSSVKNLGLSIVENQRKRQSLNPAFMKACQIEQSILLLQQPIPKPHQSFPFHIL